MVSVVMVEVLSGDWCAASARAVTFEHATERARPILGETCERSGSRPCAPGRERSAGSRRRTQDRERRRLVGVRRLMHVRAGGPAVRGAARGRVDRGGGRGKLSVSLVEWPRLADARLA